MVIWMSILLDTTLENVQSISVCTLYQIGIQLRLMDVFRPTLLKRVENKDDATQDEQKMEAWMLHGSRNCDILLLV